MSKYWDVHCRTCNEYLGLHGNHQEVPACRIAATADTLAAVAKLMPGLTIDVSRSFEFYGETGNEISVDWFAKHAGHDIAARNDYGEFANECNAAVVCPACGDRGTCRLPANHDGDHDPKRKET